MLENPTRIAVMVSGGGTNLQALIDAEKRRALKSGKIVLVVSNREDAYALTRASENGIDSVTAKKEQDILKTLADHDIEMIILAGYMKILSADFIRHYENRMINVHPSLIPSFCGKGCYGIHVHEKALAYGVKVTGATVHFVNEIPDGGKIIDQKAVYIEDGDTPEILQKRVMEQAEWVILPKAAEKVAEEIRKGRHHGK